MSEEKREDEARKSDHPDPSLKWKNMRRMAYISLLVSACITVDAGVNDYLKDNVLIFLGFYAAIITAYMGGSTFRDGWGNK